MTEPDLEVRRHILTQKGKQLRAQAFEMALNAELVSAQMAAAEPSPSERQRFIKEIEKQKAQSRQIYAAADRCEQMLAELPEPEQES